MCRKLLIAILAVISLLSCSQEGGEIPFFKLTGDNTKVISPAAIRKIENIDRPESNKLYISIDLERTAKEYVQSISSEVEGYTIQVYTNPRIIKATTSYGGVNHILNGTYGLEYYRIQQMYAQGGGLPQAISDMVNLCNLSYTTLMDNPSKTTKFFKGASITDFFDNTLKLVYDILTPRENTWGMIVSPFFMFAKWLIIKANSITGGLLLFFILNLFVAIGLHITAIYSAAHKRLGISTICEVSNWLLNIAAVMCIIVFVLWLCKPMYENIFIFESIYHQDGRALAEIYSNYHFSPISIYILILTGILYVIYGISSDLCIQMVKKHNNIPTPKSSTQRGVAENAGEKLGLSIGLFGIFMFIDSTIIYGLLGFVIVNLTINLISLSKPVVLFIVINYKKVLVALLALTLFSFWLLTNGKNEEYPQKETYTVVSTLNDKLLNVRAEPNAESRIVGSIKPDQRVEVYEVVDGFAKIQFPTQSGYAYVSAKYIREI